jgi:hypothetical protein
MGNQRVADWIMERIAELLPEGYRGAYAGAPVAATVPGP